MADRFLTHGSLTRHFLHSQQVSPSRTALSRVRSQLSTAIWSICVSQPRSFNGVFYCCVASLDFDFEFSRSFYTRSFLTEFMFYYLNGFTGGVPTQWGSLTNLSTIQLFNNSLTETIPQSFCNLRFTALKSLIADCDICPPSQGTVGCCTQCVL
jgi:hypothetical protein